MKVNSEKIENSQVVLNIELDPEAVEKGLDSAYRKIVKRVNIPGFRKGKAPRYMVERMVGREAIYEEAARLLVPSAYEEALQSENVQPFAEPEIEIVDFEPMVFKATVPLPPTVELGDYKSLRFQKEEVNITDEDVDAAISARRERQAVWEEPAEERGAQKDDQLTVNIELWHDGKMVGEKAETQTIILGSTPLFPGIEDALIGAKVGDEKEVTTTLPEDYPVEDVQGKDVTFKISVTGIKEKHLPELDDEFAKSLGDAETLDELKTKLRENLERVAKNRAEERFEELTVSAVTEQAKVEMPPVMVERELDRMMAEYDQSLRGQGVTLDLYLQYQGKSLEEFREQYRPRAEKRVRTGLVLNAIREAENVSVSDEDIDNEAKRLADELGEGGETILARLQIPEARSSFKANLLEEKIIKRLEEIVTQPEPAESESAAGEAEPEAPVTGSEEAVAEATAEPEESKEVDSSNE